jgi:transposase-like protein
MSRKKNSYSESFKEQILEDYFRNGGSKDACAKRWGVPTTSFQNWLNACGNEKKSVSLQPQLKDMDAKDQVIDDLRTENERLKKENEWHRLRVVAYERLLEIIKKEDGIDLLKKDGAKQ